MSAVYPLSIHRRVERQWAERINSQRQIRGLATTATTLQCAFNNDGSLIPVPVRAVWTDGNLIGLDQVIDFPNHSRSYDQTRRAVRFWGYDSAIEASFFINEDALTRIQPDARPDESGFLNAFDSNRDLICAVAAKVYVRGSRGSYDLVAANF
ncbi:MAG: DUF1488 domain-containing protein [Bradyrhizobium sp.]